MNATAETPNIAALIPGGPQGALPVYGVPLAALLLVLAFVLAGRKGWALSLRRSLFFFLLLSLLVLGSSLLPPDALAAARPGLLVAAQLLAWVGLVELAQALLIDLALVGWLKRPPVARILRDTVTLALALAVFLVSLRGTLGVNLSSLLATSAMISVVLGLALQDTLGSFFAGLALQMEAPLAIGDNVRIGDHQGTVTQVSWRAVRILDLDSDEVTFPNSLVTRSTLVNYSRPTPAHLCFVEVRAPHRHPPGLVLAALGEAAGATPGVLADPPAHALVWEYRDSEIIYRARFWIADFRRINYIRGAVGANIWYRLRREGIENPYPARILRREPPREDPRERVATALRRVDVLGPLTEGERRDLAAAVRPQPFGNGETVIRQGDRGDSLFVVLRGRVEVAVASGGGEEVVNTIGAGGFFGEMSLLTGAPRSASVRAVEDVEVAAVTVESFRRIVAGNPAVLEAVTGIVSRRRSRLDAAIQEAEAEAAARSAEHVALLERVRQFFGV